MLTQEVNESVVVVKFAAGVFSIDAIKRAAYRFVDRLTIEIEPHADEIVCRLRPNAANPDPAALESEFRNEVLDQDLRIQIGHETEPLRNLILSLAFSKTGLQE
jgi:His-Xaa-Ser system protein HxsD